MVLGISDGVSFICVIFLHKNLGSIWNPSVKSFQSQQQQQKSPNHWTENILQAYVMARTPRFIHLHTCPF